MNRHDPLETPPIRRPRTVRLVAILFTAGLLLGGTLVALGATASPSAKPADQDSATAPPGAGSAAATTAPATHAGMDMSAGTTAVAATAAAPPPAARTVS